MKTEKKILVAFLLNLCFSALELAGGIFTGSIAIISDAVHDFGDAVSIGISYFLERRSTRKPDASHTYGYGRYSVLGATITGAILLAGSVLVVINAVERIINPVEINHDGMIIFAIFGVIVNFIAAWSTHGGSSLNQRAVNLHMLEDVLGWAVVLVGAVVIRFTGFTLIDPIMSIGVALFILINALRSLKAIVDLFLEKTPAGIDIDELKEHLLHIDGVEDVHHIHVWSRDGVSHCATMHVVSDRTDTAALKESVREELSEHGIGHTTIELEAPGEPCAEPECASCTAEGGCGHGHHYHHHH